MTQKQVLLLVSSTSMSTEVLENQQRARDLLKEFQADYIEIDGSLPEHKKQRNQLCNISGLKVQYPQFFLVEADRDISFLGDLNELEAINDASSSLSPEFLEQHPNLITWDRMLDKEGGDEVLMLMSSMANRETQQRQERVDMLLKAHKMPLLKLDGANPENKSERNSLFEMSGMWAKYPQLFVLKKAKRYRFLGTWEEIEVINDASRLPHHVLAANPSILTWAKVLG